MANYSMTCTCGQVMGPVDAASRDAAVTMLQGGMTQDALDAHMKQFHPAGEAAPTLAQAHAMIAELAAAS
jgi:hypothetical protein